MHCLDQHICAACSTWPAAAENEARAAAHLALYRQHLWRDKLLTAGGRRRIWSPRKAAIRATSSPLGSGDLPWQISSTPDVHATR